MVTRQFGGEMVRDGIYWSWTNGEFLAVPGGEGSPGGSSRERYQRAPLPLVLIAGPLMGLAFALSLPLMGLVVLVPFLVERLRPGAWAGAAEPGAVEAGGPRG